MDPNANLAEQRRIIARIFAGDEQDGDTQRLADLANALDEWLTNARGFLPTDWSKPR